MKKHGRVRGFVGPLLIVLAGLAVLGLAVVVASQRERGPTAAELRAAPEVLALGHAHPVSGKPSKYGKARYVHEVELLDGRKTTYVSDRLISASTCLEVRARDFQGRLYVTEVTEQDAPCGGDDLGALTR